MLACRPMVSFALAVLAGSVLARFFPWLVDWLPPAWLLFLALAAWFALTPNTAATPELSTLPEGYARHILPQPGWIARRGLNRFILIASLAVFLAGVGRQDAWSRKISPARLPDRNWFNADLIALAPSRDYADGEGAWRTSALLIAADGKAMDPVPVRFSGRGGSDFRRADLVSARVRRDFARPQAFPGTFDFRLWLERDGLAGALSVATPGDGDSAAHRVRQVDDVSAFTSLRRFVDLVRAKAIALTLEYGRADGGMLAAMLYGYRKDVADDLRDAFRRVGIGHVLAISGLHVGLVVGLLWWLSGWLGWSARRRAVACLLLAFFYLGLSGGQVAARRATLMAVIHLGGIAAGRKSDMLNSLGAATFLLVLLNPAAPLDVSFQLSFTAVVFIYMGLARDSDRDRSRPAEAARKRDAVPPLRRRLIAEVLSLSRLSVTTWLGLFPIIAMVFKQVNLVGLPVNVLVIPLMSLVLVGGLLLPWLGWVPALAWLLCLPSRLLVTLALWADSLPYSSFPANAPSSGWTVAFYGGVVLLLGRGMIRDGTLRRRWRSGTGLATLLALAGMIWTMAPEAPPARGRVAHLPGRGFGAIVAESAEGGMAVIGNFSRSGLTEADWLHCLRRSGGVGVLSAGSGGVERLTGLSFHYAIQEFSSLAAVEAGRDGWRPIPGAPGVEYAVSRDARGKVVWLAVRAGEASLCVAPLLAARQFTYRLERGETGSDAVLALAGFVDREAALPLPVAGLTGILGTVKGALPKNCFIRRQYGALLVEQGVAGFDGERWVRLEK